MTPGEEIDQMMEGVVVMLIMQMDDKRRRGTMLPPPSPFRHTQCPTNNTTLLFGEALIGHSGSLQSLDRDRL